MGSDDWIEVDYGAAWSAFDAKFAFEPRYHPVASKLRSEYSAAGRAAIIEPADSVTYSISGIHGDEARYESLTRELSASVLHCFRLLTTCDERVTVLDWQHPAYTWRCHGENSLESLDSWPVTMFPDGDYHIFLGPEIAWGVFGHPWEESMCFWGSALLELIKDAAPRALGEILRSGGRTR